MTLRKALLAATVLAMPVAVQAQPVTGLYVGAGVGANFRQDVDADVTGPAVGTATPTIEFTDAGWVGVGSIGWGFGNGLRAEIEGNYRHNDVDAITGAGIPGSAVSRGYAKSYGVMANALFDFNLGLPVTPYLGAGAGYVWSEFDNVGGRVGGASAVFDDTDGRFAYQGIAGVSLALASGLALTAEYRFLGTLEASHSGSATVGGVTSPLSADSDNYNHSVLVGLRYAFNTPAAPVAAAPPPAAPPAPAVARTYLVFFDWDRADLTDRARQIITEAANGARRVSSTRIEVAGHADRSGTPQYNQRLSERRAQAVAAELVRQGVNRSEIAVTAFGESRPLVPTADGVREPQNRRVEIVLR
jgi:outer membrane protein OmpA-like peptidoglycan-associated protein